MTKQSIRTIMAFNILLAITLSANGQTDTTMTSDLPRRIDPNTALRRALLPGWGQLYNRQYYKIPFVYVGIAALAGSALLVNQRYQLYRHAYLYTARVNSDGQPIFPEYESDYFELLRDLDIRPESNLMPDEIISRRSRLEPQIRAQRDALRRNRDLLYFGIVAWYGLTIIDAYVSAHLSEFDVSESLSIEVTGGLHRVGLAFSW